MTERLIAELAELLPAYAEAMEATVSGTVTAVRPRTTPQHRPWAVLQLLDDTGPLRVMVFPRIWEAVGELGRGDRVRIRGRVTQASDGPEMQAHQVWVQDAGRRPRSQAVGTNHLEVGRADAPVA